MRRYRLPPTASWYWSNAFSPPRATRSPSVQPTSSFAYPVCNPTTRPEALPVRTERHNPHSITTLRRQAGGFGAHRGENTAMAGGAIRHAQAADRGRVDRGIGRPSGRGTGRRAAAVLQAHQARPACSGGRKPAAGGPSSPGPRQSGSNEKGGGAMNQTPGEGNRPPAVTLRIYRALARAFPQEFKNVYGDELLQVAEDAIEPVWRRHGFAGLVRLLLDVAIRVPAEYLAELRQDIRHGLRMLAGSPGFTAVALISLSLGICIATCSYSEVNGLLRDLPGVPNPDQLVALQTPTSFPNYQRFRELNDLFSGAFAYVAPVPFGIWLNGRAERTWGHLVTASYFSTLGVHALLGQHKLIVDVAA